MSLPALVDVHILCRGDVSCNVKSPVPTFAQNVMVQCLSTDVSPRRCKITCYGDLSCINVTMFCDSALDDTYCSINEYGEQSSTNIIERKPTILLPMLPVTTNDTNVSLYIIPEVENAEYGNIDAIIFVSGALAGVLCIGISLLRMRMKDAVLNENEFRNLQWWQTIENAEIAFGNEGNASDLDIRSSAYVHEPDAAVIEEHPLAAYQYVQHQYAVDCEITESVACDHTELTHDFYEGVKAEDEDVTGDVTNTGTTSSAKIDAANNFSGEV